MTVALFSGQGSQYPGMGKDILEAFPELSEPYDVASQVLDRDMKKLCFESTPEELALTINAQPAILLTSIVCAGAVMRKYNSDKSKWWFFQGVAGHSLGEYAALSFTKCIDLIVMFRLIKARAEAMHEAARENKGAMAAVLKLDPAKVEEICSGAKEYVAAVNYNSPQQTVIAGTPEGIAEVTPIFAELKGRVVPLNVAGAFHSKLMQSAADKFYESAKEILAGEHYEEAYKTLKEYGSRFFSNVTGAEKTDFSDLPEYLAQHIVSPVRFTDELRAMREAGFTRFIEFGPGKTLTGLVKKTLPDVEAWNVENLAGVESRNVYE